MCTKIVKICVFMLVLSLACAAQAQYHDYLGAGHWDTETMTSYESSAIFDQVDHTALLTVNGDGLLGVHPNQTHDTQHLTVWHTILNPGHSVIRTAPSGTSCYEYVAYDFGQPYTLSTMWVWNMNQYGHSSGGLADVTIDYSVDGIHWETLGDYVWPRAAANITEETANYAGFEGPDFGGVWAQYVVIAGVTNYGSDYFGFSEVRFDIDDPNADPGTIPTYPEPDSWDFAGDLSFFFNPNGAWSYGWVIQTATDPNAPQNDPNDPLYDPNFSFRDSPDTTDMMLYDNYFVFTGTGVGIPFWHFDPASPYLVPAVIGNPTNQTVLGIPPGRTALHGGVDFANQGNEDMSVVRWTAPEAGDYCVSGTFDSGDVGLSDNYIIVNKTNVLLAELDANFGNAFEMTVTLDLGDTLDFVAGPGTDGGGADTVPLSVSISPGACPEPNVIDPNATLWNLSNDFTSLENPHGPWSYGWTPGSDSQNPEYAWRDNPPDTSVMNLFERNYTFSGVPWWHLDPDNGTMVPALFKNTLSTVLYGTPPGSVALHPGVVGTVSTVDVAVARWTAPRAGEYLVDAVFYTGDAGDTDYYVIHNGTSVLLSQLNVTTEDISYFSFVTVEAGDTLDFVVGGGSFIDAGSTPLDVTINGDPSCAEVGVYYEADFNEDCYVNLEDFAIFALDWLKCNDPQQSGCTPFIP